MKLIATSGLPGATGTYQPNDLFDIDWDSFEDDDSIVIVHHVAIDDAPRLSAREAAALIAGLQYLTALPENARQRLARVAAGQARRRRVGDARPRIGVAETEADESLALIREAVAEGRQLEFDYRNALGDARPPARRPAAHHLARRRLVPAGLLPHPRRRAQLPRRPHERRSSSPTCRSATTRDQVVPETLFQGSESDLDVVVDIAPAALPLLADYLADSTTTRGRRAAAGHPATRARARPEAPRRRPARPRHGGLAARGAGCGRRLGRGGTRRVR